MKPEQDQALLDLFNTLDRHLRNATDGAWHFGRTPTGKCCISDRGGMILIAATSLTTLLVWLEIEHEIYLLNRIPVEAPLPQSDRFRRSNADAILFYRACQWLESELTEPSREIAQRVWDGVLEDITDDEVVEAQAFVDRLRYEEASEDAS